jgi:hypothetical protein
MIKYLNSKESRGLLKEIFDLARTKFCDELMFDPDERTLKRWNTPHSLCSVAYDTESKKVLSFFTWMITDTHFRDGLVDGTFGENDLYAYTDKFPAVLYFNTFVVTDAHHSPPLIHRLTHDLHDLIIDDQLDIVGGLSIGGLRFTEKWLKKFDFNEIGKYRGKYPILYASREQSAMLNSICAKHGCVTGTPWKK